LANEDGLAGCSRTQTLVNDADPIFIVGPSRSGTGLLRHSLNRHSGIWLTGETHYFDDLRARMEGLEQTPLGRAEMTRCEDYFLGNAGGRYRSAGRSTETAFTREELRSRAAEVGPGADAYFEAFCRMRANLQGKQRWGEKTPRHVFRIDEIVSRYPEAKVIAMIRDPRAVVVSYRDFHARPVPSEREALLAAERKRAKKSYHVLLATLLWRAATRASLRALERHGAERIRLQRFEDLVRAPEPSLEELTAWLGVDYEETMLDVNVVSSSHHVDKEESGISPEPADRWRSKLQGSEIVVIERCAGRLMDELGYDRESQGAMQVHHVIYAWLTLPLGVIRAALANRKYLGNLFGYVMTRLRLAASR
jgi:hypothetical protein